MEYIYVHRYYTIQGCKKMQKRSASDCSILLLDIPETYYWTGFILADGHINNRNDLSITLSSKDELHLKKFGEYIKYPKVKLLKNYGKIYHPQVRLSVSDRFYIKDFKEKFDIKRDKTYYPPNINWITDKNLFLALFAGYIDGDGTIEINNVKSKIKPCVIRFHVHKAWFLFLDWIKNQLIKYYNIEISNPKIGKDGYLSWCISKFELIKKIFLDIKKLDLPLLDRKWNKININYKTLNERKIEIIEFIKNNPDKNIKEIANIFDLSTSSIRRKINVSYTTIT